MAADLAAGARLIKLCVTNWLDPAVQLPDSVELTEAELSAIATAAARARVPLIAHAIGQRVAFAEAAAQGLTVVETAPGGEAAREIAAVAKEIVRLERRRAA